MDGRAVRNARNIVALVYVALAILLTIPMLVTTVPLGVDDLNHLARIYVRAHIETDPNLSREFVLTHEWVPYLTADVLLTPLARVFPILAIGRAYNVALALGLVAAVAVVRRVFSSRVGLAPAAVGLIAYNGLMAWGLIIYVLGVIVALFLFAMWHGLRDRPWFFRLLIFTAGSTALYLTHVVAFFAYGVLVASYELVGRKKPWTTPARDWGVLMGQAVPAIVLWLDVMRHTNVVKSNAMLEYNLAAKVDALLFPFLFRAASGGLEFGVLTAVISGYAVFVGLSRGWITLPRHLIAPALIMLALTLVAPFAAFGEATIDSRFSILAACLLTAGAQLSPKLMPYTLPIAAIIGLLAVTHVADVSILNYECDAQ